MLAIASESSIVLVRIRAAMVGYSAYSDGPSSDMPMGAVGSGSSPAWAGKASMVSYTMSSVMHWPGRTCRSMWYSTSVYWNSGMYKYVYCSAAYSAYYGAEEPYIS